MAKLTKRSVEALVPETKDYFVWDSQIAGFGVRVLPSGAKTYHAQYRKGGRTRRVSVGRHGKVTVEEARKLTKAIMGRVAKGENPAEEITQHRKAPTVAALCERFFESHVKERCKPSTQGEYRRAIDLFITPAIGRFKVVDVERKDIAELHHRLRDKPYQANRTLGVLSKMFNLAEVWGLRPDGSNPCRHVPKYREVKRERFLSQNELQWLGQVLSEVEHDGSETPYVLAAFRLLVLTGCRLSEIQTLKWAYIVGDCMELPDSKTGARRIPLPLPARDVLATLPRTKGNPYVIEGKLEGSTSPTCNIHGGASGNKLDYQMCAFMISGTHMRPMPFLPVCLFRWSVACLGIPNYKPRCVMHIWQMILCAKLLSKTRECSKMH